MKGLSAEEMEARLDALEALDDGARNIVYGFVIAATPEDVWQAALAAGRRGSA